jgi:hypothetical protein
MPETVKNRALADTDSMRNYILSQAGYFANEYAKTINRHGLWGVFGTHATPTAAKLVKSSGTTGSLLHVYIQGGNIAQANLSLAA